MGLAPCRRSRYRRRPHSCRSRSCCPRFSRSFRGPGRRRTACACPGSCCGSLLSRTCRGRARARHWVFAGSIGRPRGRRTGRGTPGPPVRTHRGRGSRRPPETRMRTLHPTSRRFLRGPARLRTRGARRAQGRRAHGALGAWSTGCWRLPRAAIVPVRGARSSRYGFNVVASCGGSELVRWYDTTLTRYSDIKTRVLSRQLDNVVAPDAVTLPARRSRGVARAVHCSIRERYERRRAAVARHCEARVCGLALASSGP